MTIDIKIGGEKEWSKLEENLQQGTIFHTWKWLKIVEKHTRSKLYPIIGVKGTAIIGFYPLFYQKTFLFRFVFSPPPRVAVPYLGPIIIDYDELKQDKKESTFIEFQKKVDEFIKCELKSNYILVNLSPVLRDSRPFKWTGYQVEPIYNYLINLSKGEDYVWGEFKKHLRQNINRAKRRGICVEEGSKEELEGIYDAIAMRYEEQGKVVSLYKGYLLDLYDAFYPQNMKIFVAKYNGEAIGAIVDIYYQDKVISWLGSVRANVESVSPNELLQWEAMKYAIEHGMKYYIELGANTERLCSYKSKYNPDLIVCFYAKKYSSAMAKLAETAYFKLLKPMHIRLNTRRG